VEIFIVASSEEHQKERAKLNTELIGHMGTWVQERSPRGVPRPDWFQDVTFDDIEQMARVMPTRRRAP
jgi:hypothetical protein